VEGNWLGIGGYVQYKIESSARGISEMEDGVIYSVLRRFNEFKILHSYITEQDKFKGLIVPPLPQDTWMRNYSEEFLQERRNDLEKYLNIIVNLKTSEGKEIVKSDVKLKEFLTSDAELKKDSLFQISLTTLN
jgi:hypothetical protein